MFSLPWPLLGAIYKSHYHSHVTQDEAWLIPPQTRVADPTKRGQSINQHIVSFTTTTTTHHPSRERPAVTLGLALLELDLT